MIADVCNYVQIKYVAFKYLLPLCFINGLCSGLWCSSYNHYGCISNINCTVQCPPPIEGKRGHCYAHWRNESGQVIPNLLGCWLDSTDCYDRLQCLSEGVDDQGFHFCCCEGDFCNANIVHVVKPTTTASSDINVITQNDFKPSMKNPTMVTALKISLAPILGLTAVVCLIYWLHGRRKYISDIERIPTSEPMPKVLPQALSPTNTDHPPLQLLKIIGRGRFGSVWKAQMLDEVKAVKIFLPQEGHSWRTEIDIYNLPNINNNANILTFIGAEEHETELWIITDYHERGSLYSYLKSNIVTMEDMLNTSHSIISGLAFLHDEIPAVGSMGRKPVIAHRDIKSKNILIKDNLTACIADFGLAHQFLKSEAMDTVQALVGTPRYMAPEVIEGAITFFLDNVLSIDVYAMGLVLWELVSRCSAAYGPVEEYQLPFEKELGHQPTLQQMKNFVVDKKMRPTLQDHWRSNTCLSALCDTIEECWDQDPEARLTAGCVRERLTQLKGPYRSLPSTSTVCVTCPLLTNNLQSYSDVDESSV